MAQRESCRFYPHVATGYHAALIGREPEMSGYKADKAAANVCEWRSPVDLEPVASLIDRELFRVMPLG